MSLKKTIRRHLIIVEKVLREEYPSIDNIKRELESNGYQVSLRTLKRDIEQFRHEFGVDVAYSKKENGYYFKAGKQANLEAVARFLNSAMVAFNLSNHEQAVSQRDEILILEQAGSLFLPNLYDILHSCRKRKSISFSYKGINNNYPRYYTVNPFFVKEYKTNWYLIGSKSDSNMVQSFAIKNITQLKIEEENFFKADYDHLPQVARNNLGVNLVDKKAEKIALQCSQRLGLYLNNNPIHSSQTLQDSTDDSGDFLVELFLVPNVELEREILRLGSGCKVLKPVKLATRIETILRQSLERYAV